MFGEHFIQKVKLDKHQEGITTSLFTLLFLRSQFECWCGILPLLNLSSPL